MRYVLSNILKKGGYEVVAAEDGKQALEMLESERPDMAFLDLHLPDMDGTEVLREMKKIRKDIPVVMCSGFGDVDFAVRTMKYGALDYVSKPFKNEDVLNIAKKAFAAKNISSSSRLEAGVAESGKREEVKMGESAQEAPVSKKRKINLLLPVGGMLLLAVILGAVFLLKPSGKKAGPSLFIITYNNPTAVTFDGENLWVSDWYGQTIYKHIIDEELSIMKYYSFSEIHPAGIAWGKDCVWVVDSWTAEIHCCNLDETLSVRKTYPFAGSGPSGIYFDGTFLWVCDAEDDMIYKLLPEEDDLRIIEQYKSEGPNPVGIFWDMKNIWTVDGDLKRIYKHSMDQQLTVVESYKFPMEKISGVKISGIGWDGENIWISADQKPQIIRVSIEELEVQSK
jgi:CheY-like chemotaxis protein